MGLAGVVFSQVLFYRECWFSNNYRSVSWHPGEGWYVAGNYFGFLQYDGVGVTCMHCLALFH